MVEVPNRERYLQGKPAFIEHMEEELSRERETMPQTAPPLEPAQTTMAPAEPLPVTVPTAAPPAPAIIAPVAALPRNYGMRPYSVGGPFSAYPRTLARGPNYPLPSDLQRQGYGGLKRY